MAIYAIRIARAPLDARLKKRTSDPCTLVLATRLMWLEQWFGGLDRMYRQHKLYAVWSILLLTPHLLLHFLSGFDGSQYGYAHRPASVGMGHLLGAVSAIGLLLLAALLHGWFLDLIINGSTPLLAIYVTMATIGMAAYTYDELVLRHMETRADYTVHRVERPTPDILDLTLTPTGETALPVTRASSSTCGSAAGANTPSASQERRPTARYASPSVPWAAVHAASTRT
ncbi:ferric reductase-like transmembrane domain-containing protein [Streptomyces sp. NPDC012935]|uniref:ferric reductase-like transmembrane domain-containing protein n=1 Tax=Streptomyces sp. NPDC012935 TaxID=3364857 RepID=UPI0036C30DD2